MAKESPVGHVILLEGVAFARNTDGRERQLKHGDPIFVGEIIVTMAAARVELAFSENGGGSRFLMRANEALRLDSTVFGDEFVDATKAALLPRAGDLPNILRS